MTIEISPLWPEIDKIRTANMASAVTQSLKLVWDGDKGYNAKVLTMHTKRNYLGSMAEETQLELLIPLGDWVSILYPNRKDMEAVVDLGYSATVGATNKTPSQSDQQRFRVVFSEKSLNAIESSQMSAVDPALLNMADMVKIVVGIIPQAVYKLRMNFISGVFRRVAPEDLIRGLLQSAVDSIKLDAPETVDQIDIMTLDNQEVIEQISVARPNGQSLHLTQIPSFLQNKGSGCYKGDIGIHYQNKTWWVYPLYDTSKFDEDHRKRLLIYKVPNQRYGVDTSTWLDDGQVLKINVSDDPVVVDDSGSKVAAMGHGFRAIDANKVMSGETSRNQDNKSLVIRSDNTMEANTIEPVAKSLNAPPVGYHNNLYVPMAQILARRGTTLTVVWKHCDIRRLVPGMSVRYHYLDNTGVVILQGVLHSARAITYQHTPGYTNSEMISSCELTLYVNRLEE